MRTYRAAVRELLRTFVDTVRGGTSHGSFDEEDAIEEAGKRAFEYAPDIPKEEARVIVEGVVRVAKGVLEGFGAGGSGATAPVVSPLVGLAAAGDDASEPEEYAAYILASSCGGRVTRLHKALGCWHSRTLSFHRYELVDGDLPDPDRYTAVCQKCWPLEGGDGFEAPVSSDAGTSSSTSGEEDRQSPEP